MHWQSLLPSDPAAPETITNEVLGHFTSVVWPCLCQGFSPCPVDLDWFVSFHFAIFRGQMYVCGLIILPRGA